MFFSFFFYCSAHHRDLHSFPTRRSSDLTVQWAAPRYARSDEFAAIHRATAELQQTDRKSTRLNSSHRTISYAVFCLKKKNRAHRSRKTTNTRGTRPGRLSPKRKWLISLV